jgi:MFS family permease
MRKLSLLVAAACAFGVAPFAGRLGLVGGSVLLVVLGVVLAVCASSALDAIAVASGAIGALAAGVLGTVSPAVAGAALVGAAYAERTMRVRGKTARAVHAGMSIVAGALSGALATAFVSASPAVRGVAVVMAAVLAGLPLLVDADDPIAHALDGLAALASGSAQASLREGAELRRTSRDVPLDRPTHRRVQSTWRALLRLGQVRVRLERAKSVRSESASPASDVVEMVDQRIKEHVIALGRAYSAVDTAKAAEVGLDDAALKSVETVGSALEDAAEAMVSMKG